MGLPIFIVVARRLFSRDGEKTRPSKARPRKKAKERAKRSH